MIHAGANTKEMAKALFTTPEQWASDGALGIDAQQFHPLLSHMIFLVVRMLM
jgi:hypothetical protein